jgi:hypothetical protein
MHGTRPPPRRELTQRERQILLGFKIVLRELLDEYRKTFREITDVRIELARRQADFNSELATEFRLMQSMLSDAVEGETLAAIRPDAA